MSVRGWSLVNICGDHVSSGAHKIIKTQEYNVKVEGAGMGLTSGEGGSYIILHVESKKKQIYQTSGFLNALKSPTYMCV